jgi:integrating conjugative element protein (TIGR03757 family)
MKQFPILSSRMAGRAAFSLFAIMAGAFAAPAQTAHAAANPASPAVEVFTDAGRFQLANAQGAAVYDLSAPKRLADALSRGLPANPQQAQAVATERFAAQKQAFVDAYAGHVVAMRYGIIKIPAVVFNRGEAVVYGLPDVAEAAAIYRRWKGGP